MEGSFSHTSTQLKLFSRFSSHILNTATAISVALANAILAWSRCHAVYESLHLLASPDVCLHHLFPIYSLSLSFKIIVSASNQSTNTLFNCPFICCSSGLQEALSKYHVHDLSGLSNKVSGYWDGPWASTTFISLAPCASPHGCCIPPPHVQRQL